MPAEVLVMCGQCGRPQPAGGRCVACGAVLPEAVRPEGGRGGPSRDVERTLLQVEPGRGRLLSLSPKLLLWRSPGEPPRVQEVDGLESVSFHRRPFYEPLFFVVPGLLGLWLSGMARFWTWGPVVLLALIGCFAQRQHALVLRGKDGQKTRWVLGMGRPGSAHALRYESVWTSLAPELRALGVKVEGRGR